MWAVIACYFDSTRLAMFTPEVATALGVLDLRSRTLHHPNGNANTVHPNTKQDDSQQEHFTKLERVTEDIAAKSAYVSARFFSYFNGI